MEVRREANEEEGNCVIDETNEVSWELKKIDKSEISGLEIVLTEGSRDVVQTGGEEDRNSAIILVLENGALHSLGLEESFEPMSEESREITIRLEKEKRSFIMGHA